MQGLGGIKEYISIVFGQTGMPAAKCIPIRRQEYFTMVLFYPTETTKKISPKL